VSPALGHAQRVAPEYEIKAAYLYNFVNLTEWSAGALSHPQLPFQICVADGDPFKGSLDGAISGESIKGHRVVIAHLLAMDMPSACHVLFFPREAPPEMLILLKRIATLPVLTVGESEAFVRADGMVSFVSEDGRIRFDVNRRPVAAHGLTLSSQLLRVARTVRWSLVR